MDSLELFKFIDGNSIEHHKDYRDSEEIILFVNIFLIEKWNKLIGGCIMDEGGITCVMKEGYFCFEMKHICDYHDIEIHDVFDFDNID